MDAEPKKMIAALIRFAIAAALVYALSEGCQRHQDRVNGPLLQELRQRLLVFPVPKGDRDDAAMMLFNHGGPVSAIRYLRSSHSIRELVRYYRAQLDRDGWTLIRPDSQSGGTRSMLLCKDATGFELKAWSSAGSTNYSVSLVRNGKDSGSAYCSDKR